MVPAWEVRVEIYRQWQSGQPQASLAEKYCLSISRVSQICQDTKIKLDRGWHPGIKQKPGRPSEGKQKKTVSFDPDVWEKVKDLGWKQRSKLINQILRDNL